MTMNIKYWHEHQGNDFNCGDQRRGKSGDGVDHRNQAEHHPAVYPGKACKLADLLRGGYLRSVYHGENGLRTLKADNSLEMGQAMRVLLGVARFSGAGLIPRSGEQSANRSSRDLCGRRVDVSSDRCRDTGFLSIGEAKNTLGRRGCAPNEGDTHRKYPHPMGPLS